MVLNTMQSTSQSLVKTSVCGLYFPVYELLKPTEKQKMHLHIVFSKSLKTKTGFSQNIFQSILKNSEVKNAGEKLKIPNINSICKLFKQTKSNVKVLCCLLTKLTNFAKSNAPFKRLYTLKSLESNLTRMG